MFLTCPWEQQQVIVSSIRCWLNLLVLKVFRSCLFIIFAHIIHILLLKACPLNETFISSQYVNLADIYFHFFWHSILIYFFDFVRKNMFSLNQLLHYFFLFIFYIVISLAKRFDHCLKFTEVCIASRRNVR